MLVGKLHNDIASPLKPLTCGIHGMNDRYSVYVNGAKAEDQIGDGRLYEQLTRCMPRDVRRNLATMSGFMADVSPSSGKRWLPDEITGATTINWLLTPFTSGICN